MAYLQGLITQDYRGEITKQELHLIGKILQHHKPYVTLQIKGIVLDRMFNLLRDEDVARVPTSSFSEILTSVRTENLAWRFFIDSINKLNQTNEADELFFNKALSIVQGHFRQMQTIDMSLMLLLLENLLLPHFENRSTVVRK